MVSASACSTAMLMPCCLLGVRDEADMLPAMTRNPKAADLGEMAKCR